MEKTAQADNLENRGRFLNIILDFSLCFSFLSLLCNLTLEQHSNTFVKSYHSGSDIVDHCESHWVWSQHHNLFSTHFVNTWSITAPPTECYCMFSFSSNIFIFSLCRTVQNSFPFLQSLEILKREIAKYQPMKLVDISSINVLLVGAINSGKSSFINTIDSIFSGVLQHRAHAGSATTSLTSQVAVTPVSLASLGILALQKFDWLVDWLIEHVLSQIIVISEELCFALRPVSWVFWQSEGPLPTLRRSHPFWVYSGTLISCLTSSCRTT